MATHITRIALVPAACLLLGACASGDPRTASQVTQTTPAEAARLLGCNDNEIAMCTDTNCELEEYSCTDRNDARKMFRAGEFRH